MTEGKASLLQILEALRQDFLRLLAACLIFVLPSSVMANDEDNASTLSRISNQCLQTLLKLDGGRVFEGAKFENVRKGRVRLSVGNVSVSFVLNVDRFSGQRENCSFETTGTAQRTWGFFAAEFAVQMEQIGLERQRPFTETNFKFSGCTDTEFGKSHLTVNAIFLMKSQQLVYSARSQRRSLDKCV